MRRLPFCTTSLACHYHHSSYVAVLPSPTLSSTGRTMLFAASLFYLTSLPALFYTADAKSSYTFGQACSQAQSKLAHGTYQLNTKCGPTMYCAANNTCAEKGCRRDEFPLGYGSKDPPAKCNPSTFCPDEEDACQPLLPVGSPCQLNRDGMWISQCDVGSFPLRWLDPHSS